MFQAAKQCSARVFELQWVVVDYEIQGRFNFGFIGGGRGQAGVVVDAKSRIEGDRNLGSGKLHRQHGRDGPIPIVGDQHCVRPIESRVHRPLDGLADGCAVGTIDGISAVNPKNLLAIGVGVANVEIRYGPDGLVVRTRGVAADGVDAVASADDMPWRTDLAALESALREEMVGATPRGPGAVSDGTGESEVLARVHRLIEESERRQQRDLALRFAQLMGESEAQRQADLLRIEQQVGQLQGLSEAEVVQHNEIMDYLVRVAGR